MSRLRPSLPALALPLLVGLAQAEEVRGTLLERAGELHLGERVLASDGDPQLLARLRSWVGREAAVEATPGADGKLQVTRLLEPRAVRLQGWVARAPEGNAPLLWCAPEAVWPCFGPALAALRQAHGQRVTATGWAFSAGEAPEALCVDALAPADERAEPVRVEGVVAWDRDARTFLLRPAEGAAWRLACDARRSPLPWLGRLCGSGVTLEGLALPGEGGERALLVERAASVELVTLAGKLLREGLASPEHGLLSLPPPCREHGGDDPGALLEGLRGEVVQLRGLLLRDASGRAQALVVDAAVALDGAGRTVLVTRQGQDGRLAGTIGDAPGTWSREQLRFAPEAPPRRKIPGH